MAKHPRARDRYGRRERRRAVESYLRQQPSGKLQLGAGQHALAGWFNTDLVVRPPDIHYLDSTKPFPFDGSSLDQIFSEHHLEHITYEQGRLMLAECYRVLRPGGGIRIATPDLVAIAGLLTARPSRQQTSYVEFMAEGFLAPGLPRSVAGVVNNAFTSWGHQFLYDETTLTRLLSDAGFVELTRTEPRRSRHSHFRGLERHGQFIGDEDMNRFETMVIEAVRPSLASGRA